MTHSQIFRTPIEDLIRYDIDMNRLYTESKKYFDEVIEKYYGSEEDIINHIEFFMEEVTGKDCDLESLPSTYEYFTRCTNTLDKDSISQCIRESVIRLLLMGEHGK